MSKKTIELKGSNFTILVMYIYDASPEEVNQAIEEKLREAPEFLKNAPVVINVANLNPDIAWKTISNAILSTGLHVVGISGCNNAKLKQAIIQSGLPLITEGTTLKHNIYKTSDIEYTQIQTRIINTPVRSGQKIYAQNSDLVITNIVGAGAELIADGNIHIYGAMRGRALAGASGNVECQIFCTYLSPELLSIAGRYWLSDQIPVEFLDKAARICLQNSTLTIYPLI